MWRGETVVTTGNCMVSDSRRPRTAGMTHLWDMSRREVREEGPSQWRVMRTKTGRGRGVGLRGERRMRESSLAFRGQ